MKRIGFVIVQYNNYNDTFNCVDSIKETMNNELYHITIVDNKSINNAYDTISEFYQDDSHITTIQSFVNMGYAKGANLGVQALLEKYDAELVCVLNNDIIFEVTDLNQAISDLDKPYDILAPNIYQLNGIKQNPQPEIKYSLFWINLYLYMYHILLLLNKLHLDVVIYSLAVFTMGKFYQKGKNNLIDQKYIKKLHGSCMFFTRSFLEERNRNALIPATFLFLEEDFLALSCMKDNKKILFASNLNVKHLEDQSSNSICKNTHNKRLFLYKNHIDSFKSFKNYYLEMNK